MTAETPRTEQAARKLYGLMGSEEVVDADFARSLERDLTAARARVAELETFVRWVSTYPKTRGEEINVVLIRDGARALLSPSPEPTK